MMPSVLLDTSFFIRLLDDTDPLHKNALGYFKYYLENDIPMCVSTITIAEYCVKGSFDDLPLKDIRIIPFNIDHAKRCGTFAEVLFRAKNDGSLKLNNRNIIPNDSKLFAQADIDKDIDSFVSSDSKSLPLINKLRKECQAKFSLIDINNPFSETYGLLDL
ncbi:hypothetical protein [uncultured Roseivirga sp.]|uniref:type II toxin-antitoxin system VapC family toxin n=1 Tax=uncultured Roseivirga sp. TaxID=543088 RepID=UPI0030DC4B20|tara:strand:+ start:168207 stop:168689 length:483 start_codon:yes stop_codon:yes gene_type:complete